MSLLLDRITRPAGAGSGPQSSGSLAWSGAFAAMRAAGASLVLVLAPVVLAWVAVPNRSGWFAASRVGFAAWLLAHGGAVAVPPDGRIGLLPLGLTLVPAATCWLAARRLSRVLDPKADAVAAGVSRARPARLPTPALAGFVAGYTAVAGLLVLVCLADAAAPVRPDPVTALPGAALVAGLAGLWGAVSYRAGGARAGLVLLGDRLPEWARRGLSLGSVAVAGLLGCAALALAAAVAVRFGQVLQVHRALDPGVAGTVALVALQVAYLPTFMVWTAAFLAGPGFSVGLATSVTPQATVLGPLPALPLLGALPAPGAQPRWLALSVLLPVLCGAVSGVLAARRRPAATIISLSGDGALAAAGAGLLVTVLCRLAAGPAGPGRLELTGPVPWAVGAVVAVEVLIGAWLGTALWRAAEVVAGDR